MFSVYYEHSEQFTVNNVGNNIQDNIEKLIDFSIVG